MIMKKIKLQDTAIHNSTYKELILTVLNKPIEGGTIDEQRKVAAVMGKVDAAHGFLILEDAEWALLKIRIEKYSWLIISPDLVRFCDAILQAEEANIQLVLESAAN